MNEWIVVIAALLVASVPWLLLEVFDRARQQELRALAGKHVPQIHHRHDSSTPRPRRARR